MPLIICKPRYGRQDIMIILGPDSIKRMEEKDPFELKAWELHHKLPVGVISIALATDAELTQLEQLARQGKQDEVVELMQSGFKYRPELGDHDMGPQKL